MNGEKLIPLALGLGLAYAGVRLLRAPTPSGLVLDWDFRKGPGSDESEVIDRSGNGNDGYLENGASWIRQDNGYAVRLSSGNVRALYSPTLAPGQELTLEAIFTPLSIRTEVEPFGYIISSAPDIYDLNIWYRAGVPVFQFLITIGRFNNLDIPRTTQPTIEDVRGGLAHSIMVYSHTPTNKPVVMGAPYHVIVRYKAEVKPAGQTLFDTFVDGEYQAHGEGSNWVSGHLPFDFEGDNGRGPLLKATRGLNIGRHMGPTTLDAIYRLVRVYNKALSNSEIARRF